MTDLHLVVSNSAAGSLRAAIREFGLPGKVFSIMDALELGPLSDGRARAAFWRSLVVPDDSDELPCQARDDAFAPWRDLRECVAAAKPRRILIWGSESGGDYVLLRMACHWLTAENVAMWRVPVSPQVELHSVAVHSPKTLAKFAPKAVLISPADVTAMAEEYPRIAARPELLRECDSRGRLLFRPITAHDDFILGLCPRTWTLAARVVGDVMSGSDPRNPLGYIFVASRLRHFIAIGLMEVDMQGETLRDYRICRR